MRYEGMVYRPPSEAYSLIIQVTIGCAHNKCTFCGMYKDKQFRIRPLDEVLADLDSARSYYRHVDRIFLADGDALVLPTEHLQRILEKIRELFPECRRVGIYATPGDILRKTPDELTVLRDLGLTIFYVGGESGSAEILRRIKKGVSPEQLIEAVRKIEELDIAASVTFISGLGGQELWQEHATETGRMISRMEPSYVGLLTLMLEPGTELYADIQAGRFQLLTPLMVVEETGLLVENIEVKRDCVFRSNHASNYLSLKGTLPGDRAKLLKQIETARGNAALLKDERFRLL
ncbi:MAG TPA: B12-binding domain-containing radical SAM protein [Clostridiales bacterium]|jgi:radical SAM superfamily enzyme YgiQ (UPF0313 family)|nr:B12-binding domain-containing radical SAM protein [Clostridiales bacterium]